MSGSDADSAAVWEMLLESGFDPTRRLTAILHVEQKLAARMVLEKITHATLVINNEPCPGRFGCDALLPILLPMGYSMTVHGPNNYRKIFTGGEAPP